MKRSLVIVTIILIAIAAGFVLLTKNEIPFSRETSVYKAVPVNSPLFIEINSIKSIPFEDIIVTEAKTSGIKLFRLSWLEKLDTLIKNNSEIANSLRNNSFIVAYGFAGKNTPVPLFIKKAESKNKKRALEQLIADLYPGEEFSMEKKNYSGIKINSFKANQNNEEMYFCFAGGLFLASNKSILVEQAIRQLNTQNILNNPYFIKVNKTVTEQSEICFYINHAYFPSVLTNWLNPESLGFSNEFGEQLNRNYKNRVNEFTNYASWSELDFTISKNNLILNGITAADDSLNHYLSVFNGQEPQRIGADKVLPKNTSVYISYSFSDKKRFFTNLESFMEHTPEYYNREEKIKKIENGFRVDFKAFFTSLLKNEVTLAITTIPSDPLQKNTFFILETNGKVTSQNEIDKLLSAYCESKNIDKNTLKSTFSVDNETQYDIYRFPYPSAPGIILGAPFSYLSANYVSFHENFVVFANTKEGLEDYLESMVLNSTLSKDINYLRFKENMISRGNISVYVNVNRAYNIINEIFNQKVANNLEENREFPGKFYALNWQVVAEKELFFNTINIGYNENGAVAANTAWQSNLGEQFDFKPQIVRNHNDLTNNEVILQDKSNNLHLLTNNGRQRWSIPIAGPVLGEIHQIDYFKNGKLQFLFNTKDKLYLIDRDGNNVANFPVTFRSPATNGVNVFDYDNNRNYRYFIACENKKVYAYDTEGKIITGWTFNQTDSEVTTPIQHFRVNGRDYIVFKDKSRIYIQNRRGETRVQTPVTFENSENPLVLDLNGTPKIVATDTEGKVYYFYFNGKYDEKKPGKFGKNHYFTVEDLDGNGKPDFVFIEKNELTVFNEDGKKMFAEKFRHDILHQPHVYTFSNVKKIGVVDSEDNRIFLFEPTGKQHEGFPLQGNSEFSIGRLEQNAGLSLLVGSEGGDLYNYSLN